MTDGLSTLYQDLLGGSYDCVDRIVLNAYFRMGHSPGGFRVWWRALTGSDDTLAKARARVIHDLYYIEHWSPWLDLMILLKTFATLARHPAY